MTGKEALIQVSKSCSGLALEFGSVKMGKTDNEALQTLKEIVVGYEKYKRAFEILKSTNKITVQKLDYLTIDYLLRVDDLGFKLTKEEYELLEELMKNENC